MIISKKYEVLSQLGEGGMGVVYKVRHTALESVSALKVMSTHFEDDPDLVKRFYREARVLARLNHPSIVRVIDIDRDEELKFYYFVMEFIEGRTLRDHLRDSGPLEIAQVLAITKQVAGALDYAHHYNPPVIHRDIKPTNIMIEDGSQRVVVMDFGIAKDLGEITMTRVGTMLGTLRYAPPEQLRHEALDGSADIYALGMVMYEALLGSHPFADLAAYPVFTRVASPEEHDFGFPPGTPTSFAALVSKAIRKDRSQRYRTMAELLVDIDACSFELGETTPGAVPAPGSGRGPAAGMPGEPTEVAAAARKDKIRELSEQRRRQQIRRLEAQVAEHKDMALRQGAAELVPDLFTAACAAEDLAHAQAQGDQFGPACQSLEEAMAGFKEASEQAARGGLQRQAGQARAETAAAKVEADRYGATERAQTVYRNGLMLQAKADALWENQSYREAGALYGEARSRFEDAQGVAHRSLLEAEAQAAAIKAREAREIAVRDGVEEHAADAFWEAVRTERRGDTSIGQADFAVARDLYLAAVERYVGARQQAQRARQRQAALASQAEADAARRALLSMSGAAEEAAYRQGQETQREGDTHLAAQAFEPAAAAYTTARRRFQQASASWQRRKAEEARARAVQAGERFPKDFAKALEGLARGVAAEEAGGYVAAAEAYAEAAERWSRLEEDAQGLLAQEQAGAARERLAVLRTQAVALRAWAGKVWARAEQSAEEAERAWQEQRFAEAIGLYEAALRAYSEAGSTAEAARDEQQAVEARTQAKQSESAARAAGAPQLAQERFAKATAAHQDGDRHLQNRHWEDARRHYAEAHRLYLQAREDAERTRARAAAEAALEGARAARAALQQAAAPKSFAARIEQAEALFAEAQTALGRDRWEDARAGFDKSTTRFRQLREEAIVHQAREGAAEARAQALRLQRDLGAASGWRMARAKGALARGHRLFETANYAEARASFDKAASRFEVRLQAMARLQQASASRQRRRAEEARARAVPAAERFPKDFAKALDGLARAVAAEEAGAYVSAAEAYAEAAERWSRLEEDAQGLLAQEQAGAARERLAVLRTQGAALRAWTGKTWARADQSAEEAERAWQEQHYVAAIGLYESALRAYSDASAAAEAARDEQQAVEARTQAQQSESAARAAGAPQFAQARFAKATAAHQEGIGDLRDRHWENARRHYLEAQRLYLEAREEAERTRACATAEAALEGARAARAALQQAAAPESFAARIEQAETLFAAAQTALGREHWEDARAAFDTSATRFRQLREDAIVHQAREGVAEARAQALRLQRDIGAAGGWRMARAERALARGHRLFETANYAEARASFEKAASRFEAGLRAAARRSQEPRRALPWAKILPFLGLGALAVGVAFYFMRAERDPTPVEPPKPGVQEPTAPPRVEPPPAEPLTFRPSPDAGAPIALAEGASQTFAVEAQGIVEGPLHYAWFVDDAPQDTGGQNEEPIWSYTPDFDAAGLKEIKVVVSDANAAKDEIRWRVKVLNTNRPPRFVAAMPTTRTLTVKSGETVRFSVQAEDPDRDDALAYAWNVDGVRMAEGERFDLMAGASGARQRVEVAIADRTGLSERRSWEIAVEAPPLPPLAIRAASPKLAPGQELVLTEGQNQAFSIEVAGGDPAALGYVWELDGKKQATGSRWTYEVPASGTRTKELRVVVSGGAGPPLEHLWRIRVNPANRPPTIVRFTPTDTRIEVARGTAQRFTVEATDADAGDPLAYSWLLDGRPRAKGSAFEMDEKVSAGQHRVEVKVSDKSGQTVTQRWTVAIAEPASPPSITAVQPAAERITAETDGALDFSAGANLSGDARKGAVTYEWRVDTGPSRTTTTGQFRLPPLPAGTHKLTVVAVSPEGLKSSPRDWTIEVKPKATKTGLAESEVRDWLALYRRAWESKDVDLLIQLGEVTRDRAPQLRDTLAGYEDFRMEVKDLAIRIDADSARVTFRREDTIDGKTLPHPGLKEVLLEKQANGRLTRRK